MSPERKALEAAERLRKNLEDYDAEVAYELSTDGERADLWTEIDVSVEDLRSVLAALSAPQVGAEAMVKPLEAARHRRRLGEGRCSFRALEAATPPDELSGNTGELIDKMADAIRGDTILDDTPWETLSEDRKIGWRGDAERALAVVKEYLTARAATPPDVARLWVPANPEHKKIGWTYDFDQIERIKRAAEKATGYDATMEIVQFVMIEADRRAATAAKEAVLILGGDTLHADDDRSETPPLPSAPEGGE